MITVMFIHKNCTQYNGIPHKVQRYKQQNSSCRSLKKYNQKYVGNDFLYKEKTL